MAVINIERVESVMQFSPSISIKEVLDLDDVQSTVYDTERYGIYITAYINGDYYRIVSAEYYKTLEEAHQAMSDILESWRANPNRIIKTKL